MDLGAVLWTLDRVESSTVKKNCTTTLLDLLAAIFIRVYIPISCVPIIKMQAPQIFLLDVQMCG